MSNLLQPLDAAQSSWRCPLDFVWPQRRCVEHTKETVILWQALYQGWASGVPLRPFIFVILSKPAGWKSGPLGDAKAMLPIPVILSESAGANATKDESKDPENISHLKCRFRKFLPSWGPSVLLHRYSLEHGIIDVPKLVWHSRSRL